MEIRVYARATDMYGQFESERTLDIVITDNPRRAMQMYESAVKDNETLGYEIIKGSNIPDPMYDVLNLFGKEATHG